MSTKDGLIFYKSFFEAIKELEKEDQLQIYQAIPNYVFEEKEPQLKPQLKPIWILIKPQLDANIIKRKAGKKGGRPSKETTNSDLENMDFDNL